MRRSGYNSLSNSEDNDCDVIDSSPLEDVEEATPLRETRITDETYKKTLCLVFILFFGGFVSSLLFM